MESRILLMGLNYHTAGVEIREKFALTEHCGVDTWALPTDTDQNGTGAVIRESFILSTCNRVEILVIGNGDRLPDRCLSLWAEACGQTKETLSPYIYTYENTEAIRHLFTVASSLDSMVVGEPQILGQLKEAYRKATLAKMTGSVINRLLHRAFFVAKRVRTETKIAANAVSVSYAAVELARRIFGNMKAYKAMLIGAGEMAELAATHLLQAGLSQLIVCNRTYENACALAERFHGIAVPFEKLSDTLADADIVITSTGASSAILHSEDIVKVLKRRHNKPMFFIDIAVPRNVDPDVNNLDNVYLYDIDDLREVVEENIARRKNEAVHAKAIVDEETQNAEQWLHSLDIQPVIVDLLTRLDSLAETELNNTCKHLGNVAPEIRDAMSVMLHSYSKKIINNSLEYIKQAHQNGETDKIQIVRELFALDEPLHHRHCRHRVTSNDTEENENE